MGLDMYLYKKHYVKNWDHMKDEERHTVEVKKGGKATAIKPERISYITEQVAYWRKANAIHQWFVDNVQDGKDDCGDYYVPREKLEKLLEICKTVVAASRLVDGKIQNGKKLEGGEWVPIIQDGKKIDDATTAQILLPTQEGFFFGGTDYDEYYYSDIEQTVETLSALLEERDDGDFYYHSSW